ncbi:hypothetical protein KZJ38_02920 [Paraburkholderia edwinii]|uniref:HD/PDEase domain-containing protein n=1 Tax=Paraburkholderia edwinii TaxID=2861782 RepID=A0ABX8UPQ4_9BURK|nr:hypothetical protein [Paraburkholderia edwinii]QYD69342.1 hypothetical protein KZJ38_02920 [Paraburkholderia edwinii]
MPGSFISSFHRLPDPEPRRFQSMDDNLARPTQRNLAAVRKTEMAGDLRKQIGRDNMHTFPRTGSAVSASRSHLVALRVIDPYVKHLQNTGQLADQDLADILRSMVSRLGKSALDQQRGNPQQYVSHGFDHSERVAAYMGMIAKAYPEIAAQAASKYEVTPALARFLFQVLAHWHDVGYPDLDGRPKATHGLSGASRFDSVAGELNRLITREHGRADQALSDMRKAIQLHSADVDAGAYPINVKTDRGSLLVPDVVALEKLLHHYSASSRRTHQVLGIEIRGDHARDLERQINSVLKSKSPDQPIRVVADEEKPEYTGRPTSLDKNNEVQVGLRYTDLELTKNPFAIIRFADNLDMAADRLSPLQRTPAFRAMYWKLGDHGPIGQALAGLSKLDANNASDVHTILRDLREAGTAHEPTDVDSLILCNVAQQFSPDVVRNLDASAARRLLIKATVDSVLSSPIAEGLSDAARASLRETGYRLNGESIRHFGGCEAIEAIEVKRGKVLVTVNGPLYQRLNEVKDPDGTGIGEYQIERARQAFSSLTINGRRLVVEVVERRTT